MTQQRPRSGPIPVRVHFRSPSEQSQEPSRTNGHKAQAASTYVPVGAEALQARKRTRQIKEVIRLGNMLRADLNLDEVLQRIAASMSGCTGFRIGVIKLIEAGDEYLTAVAFTGISPEIERQVRASRESVQQLERIMRPEYRKSQSFFISHEHISEFNDIPLFSQAEETDYKPGGWHPDDLFIVPLYSPRRRQLLGILSLDDPIDGKIPTLESIEMIELFANQAAIAVDNAQLFEEHEAERRSMYAAITAFQSELEAIQQGDLRARVYPIDKNLQPLGDAVNALVEHLGSLLSQAQTAAQIVNEQSRHVQHNAESLLRDAHQQERHIQHISHATDQVTIAMNEMSERATMLSQAAVEAVEVTMNGRSAADRGVQGMTQVRETALLSTRTMKRLSESEQEINEAVQAITDLTTRMNLLALNAAIEGTRAGEHGQGFAVVAQEIRALAVHSGDAAHKVDARVRVIQQQTTAVSQSIEASTREIVDQTELVTQTGLALDAISVVTDQMASLIEGMCVIADRQAEGTKLVTGTVQEISHMTGDIIGHIQHMQRSLDSLVQQTGSLRAQLASLKLS